ncbi:hypothetical protein VNI00_004725 [Paramarasmius palmivorus]|uniref:T6SS Phospholipase effector Tle1-like catalytic domain-containing protein n=1 Tax=Paramarasmius palmivorus TaxID=297713 RepID=A0AAW0DHS2_9AGAR
MAESQTWYPSSSTDVEDVTDLGIANPIPWLVPVGPGFQQPHYDCVHAARPSTGRSRNLVVCIDGTANQFGDKNTNVVELYSRLEKDDHLQMTYYNSGIGTHAKSSGKSLAYYQQVISHKIDMAIAWRFERILLDAYHWLRFSRGAYQVRALSGMIEKVGLIHRGNQAQIPFAYDLYRDTPINSNNIPRSSEHQGLGSIDSAAKFKEAFCRKGIRVHFVGVWDTVSSVGFVKKKDLPLTTAGMEHVCFFRHALALDERRVKFLPEFVNGSAGPKLEDAQTSRMPHTKEVWFTGTHSDIGGGNIENKDMNKNGPALRWMSIEATEAGLLLSSVPWNQDKSNVINESLTGLWRLLEILPVRRSTYHGKGQITRVPHLGHRRKILPGQLIHRSVYGWDPLCLEYHEHLGDWNGKDPKKIEPDKAGQVTRQIEGAIIRLIEMDMPPDECFKRLMHLGQTYDLFGSNGAIQAFINLSQILFHPVDLVKDHKCILATIQVLQVLAPGLFQRQHLTRQPPVIRELLRNVDMCEKKELIEDLIKGFLRTFGTAEIFSIHRGGPVTAFAFSPDGTCIACGTSYGHIFFRDVHTGAEIKSTWNTIDIIGNTCISCLAFSPDGKIIASGSNDSAIRLWDVKTGRQVNSWHNMAEKGISSLSFAWNGQLVATSETSNIYVFDCHHSSGHFHKPLEVQSHKHDVLLAVFSPKFNIPGLNNQVLCGKGVVNQPLPDRSELGLSSFPGNELALQTNSGTNVVSQHTTASSSTPTSHSGLMSATTESVFQNNLGINVANQHATASSNNTTSGISTLVPTSNEPCTARNGQDQMVKWLRKAANSLLLHTGSKISSSMTQLQYIVSVSHDKTFCVLEPKVLGEGWTSHWTSPQQANEIRAVAFSDEPSKFFVGLQDGSVSRWDCSSQAMEHSWSASTCNHSLFPGGKQVAVNSLAIAPKRLLVACGLEDGRLTMWAVPSGGVASFRSQVQHTSSVMSVSFSPDESRIAANTKEGIVVVWDVDGPAGECILQQLKS